MRQILDLPEEQLHYISKKPKQKLIAFVTDFYVLTKQKHKNTKIDNLIDKLGFNEKNNVSESNTNIKYNSTY